MRSEARHQCPDADAWQISSYICVSSLCAPATVSRGRLSCVGKDETGFTRIPPEPPSTDLTPLERLAGSFDESAPPALEPDTEWSRPNPVDQIRPIGRIPPGRLRHPALRRCRPENTANGVRRGS